MQCDYCNYEHCYNGEHEFFQGEMWGLPNGSVMCNNCMEKGCNNATSSSL